MASSGSSSLSSLFGLLRGGRGDDDSGSGSLDDYDYDLRPKKKGVTMRVAGSDEHRDELATMQQIGADEVWAMIARRSIDDERVDAPMPVKVFASTRVSGVVGIVPRGLEAPVDAALARVSESGKPARIPADIVETKAGLRLVLKIGETR